MIHRALLGSVERTFAMLCEQYAGKWPFWLSPRQVIILTVSNKHADFAEKVKNRLVFEGFYADVDDSNNTLKKKIRNAQLGQYNYILVAGDKELENGTVTVRERDKDKESGDMKVQDFVAFLHTLSPKPSKAELNVKSQMFV